MAGAMVGEGTGYADLTYTVGLNSEEYGVGFRKGSDLVPEINAFFDECLENGKMMEKLMPDAALVIFENDDHYAYFHQAQRFNLVLDAFLESDYQ